MRPAPAGAGAPASWPAPRGAGAVLAAGSSSPSLARTCSGTSRPAACSPASACACSALAGSALVPAPGLAGLRARTGLSLVAFCSLRSMGLSLSLTLRRFTGAFLGGSPGSPLVAGAVAAAFSSQSTLVSGAQTAAGRASSVSAAGCWSHVCSSPGATGSPSGGGRSSAACRCWCGLSSSLNLIRYLLREMFRATSLDQSSSCAAPPAPSGASWRARVSAATPAEWLAGGLDVPAGRAPAAWRVFRWREICVSTGRSRSRMGWQ